MGEHDHYSFSDFFFLVQNACTRLVGLRAYYSTGQARQIGDSIICFLIPDFVENKSVGKAST